MSTHNDTDTMDGIDTLLEQGKFEEVQNILETQLDTPLDEKDRGRVYVRYAELYMRMMNGIQGAYAEALEEAIAAIRRIREEEKKTDDLLAIKQTRKKIKDIKK